MKTEKTIGILLIAGALGVLIPYTMLTIIFDYPNILRLEPGFIMERFQSGGSGLIMTWWAFAFLGLPLIRLYSMLGQKLEQHLGAHRWITTIGIAGLLVQMIGLLRWAFVVPVLAQNYISGTEMTREASKLGFQLIHQFGGVLLGEHLGQLFTIIWTVYTCYGLIKLSIVPKWVGWFGYISASIYLLAQLELFATVIPGTPTIEGAGFLGSTGWVIWLFIVGWLMLTKKQNKRTVG